MSLASKWFLQAAGHDRGRERSLAEVSRAADRRLLERDLAADEMRFQRRMDDVARVPNVVLGTTATGVPYRIRSRDLTSLPSWTTAATGAGKSRFVGAFMARIIDQIVRGEPVSIVALDGKGESADQLLRTVGQVAGALARRERDAFLSRVHTFRFFDHTYLPSWPLLAPIRGVPIATQAEAIAEVLSEIVADATVGPRQRSTLAAVLALAVEFRLPAAALPWLLNAPSEVAELAMKSSVPLVRLDLSRFDREPQGSVDGLIARLGTVLRVPSLKAVLSGTDPFDFTRCFEPGAITVLDFGGAELGARAAVRAMGSIAISAIANAAFDPRRSVRGTTAIMIDEPQAFLTSVALGQFERLVTLGRSFGVGGLGFIHQGPAQLPQEFQTILNTNVPLRILGRSSEHDATLSSEWLPRTGRVPRPREPGVRFQPERRFLSEGQEDRFRIAEIGRLPPRHFLVSDRRSDFAPRVVQAPEYDPPAWSDIEPTIAAAVRRGSVGVPRVELEARVRQIEDQAVLRLEGQRQRDDGAVRRGRRPPVTPDVVGQPSRGRCGEVP